MSSETPTNEQLNELQRKHLSFLEGYFSQIAIISGVPILQAMNYKTIQVVNNLGLKELVGDEEE